MEKTYDNKRDCKFCHGDINPRKNKYKFWFNDNDFGISEGNSISDAFKCFILCGFDFDDVENIEIEEIN